MGPIESNPDEARLYTAGFRCAALIAVVGLGAVSGCTRSQQGPATVEVTGTVTYEGQPIDGANVIFHPANGSDQTLASQALTDKNGRFELSTHVGGGKFKTGIVPGNYAVTIKKLDTAAIANTLAPPKDLLPNRYGSPKTSGLTAKVADDQENEFQFALAAD
jgi:hypothetical protein